MMQTGHMQVCCVLMMFVDLSTVSLKDRRSTMTSLLDTFEDNTIIIIEKCFKSIVVLADVTFRLVVSLFHKTTQTSSADASKLRMKDLNIVYKVSNGAYLLVDPYVCHPIKNLLLSNLDFCTKRLGSLEFNFSCVSSKRGQSQIVDKKETLRDGFLNRLNCAGSEVLKKVGFVLHVGCSHTLPVYFENELDEESEATIKTYVVCDKESNYDKPAIPNYFQNSHDGKNAISDTPEKRTSYTHFVEYITRLATFRRCNFLTNHQTFAHLGFFYKGQGDKVCCYECGVTLSEWRKDDDPLLEHIRYSPECRHLATVIDPTFLASCKGEFQRRHVSELSFGATGVRQEKHVSHWNNKKIRSPEYSSHSVRLSTFARFPIIPGVNVHIIAAAGFYFTGQEDIVRCYACDGGLKKWAPGDDAWEEHYKWFPDCPHLQQPNYKTSRRKKNDEISERKPKKTTSTSAEGLFPSDGLVRRMDQMTIGEGKKRQQDTDPDMNTPAALAAQEHGYSKPAVKMAINELRKKGRDTLTAMSILDVLLSYQDKGIKLPTDDLERVDPTDKKLERRQKPLENELIKRNFCHEDIK